MKTIHEGTKWWTGLEATCATCNAVAKLEKTDKPVGVEPAYIYDACPTCNSTIYFFKPKGLPSWQQLRQFDNSLKQESARNRLFAESTSGYWSQITTTKFKERAQAFEDARMWFRRACGINENEYFPMEPETPFDRL